MFGKKQQEINRLAAEVAHYQALPYLGLAEELQKNINERIASGDYTEVTAVNASVEAKHADVRSELLEDKLDRMEPEEFFALYRAVTGEEMAVKALKRIALVREAEVERQAALAEMEREAQVSHILDLTKLPVGQIVELGLFHQDVPKPQRLQREFAARRITGRVDRKTQPNVLTVLHDDVQTTIIDRHYDSNPKYRYAAGYLHPELSDHEPFEFGTYVDGRLKKQLTLDTQIAAVDQFGKPSPISEMEFGYLVTAQGQQLMGRLDKQSLHALKQDHSL